MYWIFGICSMHISDISYLNTYQSAAYMGINFGGVKMNAIEMQNEQAEDPIQSPCGINLQFQLIVRSITCALPAG